MNFWTVAEVLADWFPELKAEVGSHLLGYWEMNARPYPHEFLEAYLLPLLASPEPEERTRRAYQFLEEVLTNQDEDLVGAGILSALGPIVAHPEWLEIAVRFMGSRSAEWAEELRARQRG